MRPSNLRRLAILVVHTAQGSAPRVIGSAALDDAEGDAARGEFALAVGPREAASGVLDPLWLDHPGAGESDLNETHAASNYTDFGDRDDEPSSPRAVLRLLRDDLVEEIPGQQKKVVRLVLQQVRRRQDAQSRARRLRGT